MIKDVDCEQQHFLQELTDIYQGTWTDELIGGKVKKKLEKFVIGIDLLFSFKISETAVQRNQPHCIKISSTHILLKVLFSEKLHTRGLLLTAAPLTMIIQCVPRAASPTTVIRGCQRTNNGSLA